MLANMLGNLPGAPAHDARSWKLRLARRSRKRDGSFAAELARARQAQAQARQLARDIRTLTQWPRHDILALAGPRLATRRALSDFIVGQLLAHESQDARCIRPVRIALQNQRDDVLRSPAYSMRNSPGSRRLWVSPTI
jgi:hypothetical protein